MSATQITGEAPPFHQKVREPQRLAKNGEVNDCCSALSGILGFVLLIVGISVAAGGMSGAAIGGCAIGISILMALASCISQRKAPDINDVVYAVVMTILGSLACAGVITPTAMGWCLILHTLVNFAINCFCSERSVTVIYADGKFL